MKRAFIFAALSVVLAAPMTDGARAQGAPQALAADLLPPHEVPTILASMGLRPLSRPIWRGDRYVLFAIDRHGQEVRVVLDAHNGQVLAVRPAVRGFAQGNGAPPYGYDQGYAPPPPSGYPPARPAPYDPRYGAPSVPPGAVPGAPPPAGDDDYFDDDRQQGSLPPPPAGSRTISRDVPTGTVPRRMTAVAPKDRLAKDSPARDVTPVPRPRPELAKANDAKPDAAQPAASRGAAKPPVAGKDAVKDGAKDANDAAKKDVRVIDMSKPKPDAPAEPKPGEAIRF